MPTFLFNTVRRSFSLLFELININFVRCAAQECLLSSFLTSMLCSQIAEELNNQKKELQTAMSLLHMEELKCRKRVLRRLGYATEADVIEMKGRVACELSK